MPTSTSYVCIDTERENDVIGPFIYVTFGLVLIFILYSQDQKERLAQVHPQVHGWAGLTLYSSPCGLLKTKAEGYPCQIM